MNSEYRRAILAAIETKTWHPAGHRMTGAEVVQLYYAIEQWAPAPWCAVGAKGRSDRRFDVAVRILKRARLVTYCRYRRAWVARGNEIAP